MNIQTYLANPKNYGGKRSTSQIKYIVIHYTGNDGDRSINNCKYFQNNVVEVSAHYFVDDTTIYRSVPDNYIAWHCGANKYYCGARNTNSIGVEMCDTYRNGKYELSAKTRANVVELVAELMKKYNVPIENVVRHYDVSHKKCPAYFVDNTADWYKFKNEISAKVKGEATPAKKKYSGVFPNINVTYYITNSKGKKVKKTRKYLQRGDKGTQVKRLQQFLNWYGGYKLDVDGIFGAKTEKAVKAFQKAFKLDVDGLFGKQSLAKAKQVKK